eukprot:198603_1
MAKKSAAGMIIGGLAVGALAAATALATANDIKQEKRARRELHKHKDLVEQKKQYVEHGNIQLYDPMVQTNIALLGFFNKYLSGFKNGKFELNQDSIASNEMFTSIPVTEGIDTQKDYRCKVCFQLNGTNLYLCCEKNGKLAVRKARKKWETWIVEQDNKSGMFSFKSHHNTYLCAQKGKPNANRKNKGDYEKWRVVVIQQPQKEQLPAQPVENQSTKGYTPPKQQQQVPMAQNKGSYYNQPG